MFLKTTAEVFEYLEWRLYSYSIHKPHLYVSLHSHINRGNLPSFIYSCLW